MERAVIYVTLHIIGLDQFALRHVHKVILGMMLQELVTVVSPIVLTVTMPLLVRCVTMVTIGMEVHAL